MSHGEREVPRRERHIISGDSIRGNNIRNISGTRWTARGYIKYLAKRIAGWISDSVPPSPRLPVRPCEIRANESKRAVRPCEGRKQPQATATRGDFAWLVITAVGPAVACGWVCDWPVITAVGFAVGFAVACGWVCGCLRLVCDHSGWVCGWPVITAVGPAVGL